MALPGEAVEKAKLSSGFQLGTWVEDTSLIASEWGFLPGEAAVWPRFKHT